MCFEAVAAIGTLLGGATSIFSGAGGRKSESAARPPAPSAPAVMPLPDDEASRKAGLKQVAAIRQRSGRASTFLRDFDTEKLG